MPLTDDPKTAKLRSHALELLQERSGIRRIDNPYVFPAQRRMGKPPKPIDIDGAWKRAIKRSGVEDFRFHDLRHTAASYLAMSGASLSSIAKILGHKSLSMTMRYAHISDDHASGDLEKMTASIFANTKGASDAAEK